MAAITEFGGLKVGDDVMIYEDPVSKLTPEGQATLVAFCTGRSRADGTPEQSLWTVRFLGFEDDGVFDRVIFH